jgi:DNA helicase-2/ATP-dependent DNA helicase PcrA
MNLAEQTISSTSYPYLTRLNPPQRQAVETTEGPLLVLSGAGTGKTSVLTARIAHILNLGLAYPSQILAVTFTNKAAREMAHRASQLVASKNPTTEELQRGISSNVLPWLGTFHSISAKILRRQAEKLGFTSDFIILDVDDQLRLLKTILEEMNLDVKQNPPKQFSYFIQQWKDKGLTPEKIGGAEAAMAAPRALEIYKIYQERLKRLNAMDFGDLLLHNLTLFAQHEDVLKQYANQFRYILVDEYQDTNVAQYIWLRLLALGHKNLCCVGDDDQSIYGWRGAEVGNILKFEKDFPGAAVIRLEQNYRSTPHILAAASHLIDHNQTRLGKTLWTEAKDGEKIKIQSAVDSEEEAYLIGEQIEAARRKGETYKEMAVLVRAGFQTRQFEERFLTLGLPYQVVGGLRFYERQEIKDIIAYLRVVQNPRDNLAFERIINLPKRGVGNATLEKFHSAARAAEGSLFHAAEKLIHSGEMRGKVADVIGALLKQFHRWQGLLTQHPINELTDMVLEESGYRAMWEKEKNAEANGRLENLRELVRAMGEFETLSAFLEHVGLVTDSVQQNGEKSDEMVTLMTLHAAKGLEFNRIFLPGWEEGLFPHQRSLDESGRAGLEEERRLAYVGLTRARKHVLVTHAERRRFFTKGGVEWQSTVPSRFLTELPSPHVEMLDAGSFHRYQKHQQQRSNFASEMSAIFQSAASPSHPRAGGDPESNNPFAKGKRVFHQKFGYGKIISTDGDTLEIAFEKSGVKKIMQGFVESV